MQGSNFGPGGSRQSGFDRSGNRQDGFQRQGFQGSTMGGGEFAGEFDSIEHLQKIADLLDSRFQIPGTSFRVGLDSLLGLIPGVGDTVGALFTAYLLMQTRHYSLPWHVRGRMLWNLFIDWLIGLIPFFGDIFDATWKANNKNMALLRKHAARARSVQPSSPVMMKVCF
jgi:hypothetical protein